jgi:hypothetical protein
MEKNDHLIVGYLSSFAFIMLSFIFFGWFDLFNVNLYGIFKTIILFIIVIGFYCLLPDLDHKSGTITWFLIGLSIVGMFYGFLFNEKNIKIFFFLILVFTYLVGNFFKHRGFIHSITFGLISSFPLFFIFSYDFFLLAFISFYSHLCADKKFFKFF